MKRTIRIFAIALAMALSAACAKTAEEAESTAAAAFPADLGFKQPEALK